jgi:hypothetical protein
MNPNLEDLAKQTKNPNLGPESVPKKPLSVLIKGEAGSGKTALLLDLFKRIDQKVPVLHVNGTHSDFGKIYERFNQALSENKDVVVCFDEIDRMLPPDRLYLFLNEHADNPQVCIVGVTNTGVEFFGMSKSYFDKLERKFQVIGNPKKIGDEIFQKMRDWYEHGS